MPVPRSLFAGEHEQFRDSACRFVEREAVPRQARREERVGGFPERKVGAGDTATEAPAADNAPKRGNFHPF